MPASLGSGKLGRRGRPRWSRTIAASTLALIAGALVTVGATGTAQAAPGSPQTPGAPTALYTEDFENGMGTTPVLLNAYTGATGMTYTADPAWLTGCNGDILSHDTPGPGNCTSGGDFSRLQDLAQELGAYAGAADPDSNHVVAAYTENDPGADAVEFQTTTPISLPTATGRFLTFSVDADATNCRVSGPQYQFSLTDGGASTPVGGLINPCTSGGGAAGTYSSNGSVLFTGASLGITMTNHNGSGIGNDAAFDNIRLLDATPQLDKSFSPASIPQNGVSTLTITVTNTSELAHKHGWAFTDALPTGVTVAGTGAATNTCAGTLTATAGSGSVELTDGDLAAGAAYCEVTVPVTSSTVGNYTNGAANMTLTGLDAPADSTLAVTPPAPWSCDPYGYLFQSPSATVHDVSRVNLATGEATPFGDTADNVNAVGYDIQDDLFYGWDLSVNQLVSIDSGLKLSYLGDLGLPGGYIIGDVDDAGHFWLSGGGAWVEIDLTNPASPTVADSGTLTDPAGLNGGNDWSWINGALYRVMNNTAGDTVLVRFDPATGTQTDLGDLGFTGGIGATYADAAGYLYASDNGSGEIHRIDVATSTATLLGIGPKSGGNDGARCATAPIPTITLHKQVTGRIQPADQFTVSLLDSTGKTLTSATTVGGDTSASTTNWPVTEGETYTITDAMTAASPDPIGQYTATLVCTDTTTGATVTTPGTAPTWTLTVDTLDAYDCVVTNASGTSLAVSKVSSPDPYVPGAPLTYTVTVTNGGPSAAVGAHVSDPLPAALAGAGFTWTCAPSAGSACTPSGSGDIDDTVTVAPGGQIVYTVTGTVPAGVQGGLSNTATVTPPPGATDPGCTPSCSSTVDTSGSPHTALSVIKSADPDPYVAGAPLTYTITVSNAGPSSAFGVHVVDPLPVALSGFTWTCSGTVGSGCGASGTGDIDDMANIGPAGQVIYTVTGIAPAGPAVALSNTATVTPPPGAADPGCTPECSSTVDIAGLSFSAAKTASVTHTKAGGTVTYTVVLTNTGTADYTVAVPASFTDDLSDVLDDATYNGDATGGATVAGATLSWTGALAVGTPVTITYSVTVNRPDTGDGHLANVLTTPAGSGGSCSAAARAAGCSTDTTVDPPTPPTGPGGGTTPGGGPGSTPGGAGSTPGTSSGSTLPVVDDSSSGSGLLPYTGNDTGEQLTLALLALAGGMLLLLVGRRRGNSPFGGSMGSVGPSPAAGPADLSAAVPGPRTWRQAPAVTLVTRLSHLSHLPRLRDAITDSSRWHSSGLFAARGRPRRE